MLAKITEKVVDTAANLAVGGVGAAVMSDVAHKAGSAYVGGGFIGEDIVGPSAAIMGGIMGGTISSAAYNALPSMDTVNAIKQEMCPVRATRREPVKVNPARGPMMRSLDNTGANQIALELQNQKALFAKESEARRKAETKTADAEKVAKELS